MTRSVLGALAALAALSSTAWIVACAGAAEHRATPQHVPATWRDVRDSAGHVAHVVKRGVACRDCHGEDGFAPPPLDICSRCHPAVRATLHPDDPLGHARAPGCQDCHGFGATPAEAPNSASTPNSASAPNSAITPNNCMRCHRDAQGRQAAVGAHAGQNCTDCHRAHATPALDPKPCASCHADEQNHHAGARSCLDCHQMHEASAVADQNCATCHARQRGKIKVDDRAITVGHSACTGCHKPHAFDAAETVACTTCHTRQHVIAPPKHASCTSCHAQHEGAAARPCTGCYAQ